MEQRQFREEIAGVVIVPTLKPEERNELLRSITETVREVISRLHERNPKEVDYNGTASYFAIVQGGQPRLYHIPEIGEIAEFTHLSLTGNVFPDGTQEADVLVELPGAGRDAGEPPFPVHWFMPTNVREMGKNPGTGPGENR